MPKQRVRLTEENDPLTSTESVFATFEQVSKVASQQAENIALQEADNTALSIAEKSTSQQAENVAIQEVDNTAGQEVKKMSLRKSTFQLSEQILKQLDIYHLQLQLEMGKAVAPYKEVIVEEAISQFLENPDIKSLERLLKRQKTR